MYLLSKCVSKILFCQTCNYGYNSIGMLLLRVAAQHIACAIHATLIIILNYKSVLYKEPIYIEAGMTIQVHLWRCSSSKKVWYEWAVTCPLVTSIHNPGGRSYWIGL